MKYYYFLLLYLFCMGCQKPGRQSSSLLTNKFNDTTLQTIYTAQDERQTSVLLPYLTHADASYRQEAAQAFASVQDSQAITSLTPLLTDPESTVRRAAAYALGQTGKASVEEILQAAIEKETVAAVNAELLEALGKCATQKGLETLVKYDFPDPIVQAGQAWGIYRAHSRPLQFKTALPKIISLLSSPSPETRLAASHFLARTTKLDITPHTEAVLTAVQIDPSPEVRMAAALALSKSKATHLPEEVAGIMETEPDYRVRLNSLRALTNQVWILVKPIVWRALTDKNINVALTAADLIAGKSTPEEAPELLQKAEQTLRWRVRASLLATAMKQHPDKKQVLSSIQERYQQTNNFYEKAALLSAAAKDIAGASFVEQETFAAQIPVVRTYGIEALTQLRSEKNFPSNQKKHFANLFQRTISSGDIAAVGITAGILRQPELNFKADFTNTSFLKTALDKLVLPRDNEAYQEVAKTVAYFEGKPEPAAPKNPFSHPIDWNLVKSIPANQKVAIQTNRGEVILQLFVEQAPGTVANFVLLARNGFFNDKNFHRVVPNFVIQGGDPRGDGWGGRDYAIRSEFANLRYREGFVGMASAGKDTESCQWFITHSPTPHLDGRYTIFAKVVKGLEVLPLLEVGDKIIEVRMQ
ncbi:peptidylprolyl isomerase [Adhaeribacter radiodurans]|uniref:peptidylprolyl isomerase n=1 Tax=Adhaeribacter radiodurans TaxID=2745197 RepID=A0A7L7LC67_9BACT|nr:peptidylprolyl isomerase [Adhaeribacter radiodurans]QMU30440.1 peptidylprolyl isomerase [Adhaeribacter radiodurans]